MANLRDLIAATDLVIFNANNWGQIGNFLIDRLNHAYSSAAWSQLKIYIISLPAADDVDPGWPE